MTTTDTQKLRDFLARDKGVTLARKQHALAKDIVRIGEVMVSWKPEDVIEIADPELLDSIERLGRSASRWAESITKPAGKLRVVPRGQ